jgi:dihydrofolate reductase
MRNVIVSMFVSLDGVTEAPEKWSLKFWNDDIAKFKHDELFAADALLLGRVTFEVFAASWPSRTDDEYADRMNSIRKVVASTTLEPPEWNNSTLIKADVASEVSKLKQQGGRDILVFGSTSLLSTLMEHDLVDEYRLLVYPIVLGKGKRLFKDGSAAKLKFAGAKALGSDAVLLSYAPVK